MRIPSRWLLRRVQQLSASDSSAFVLRHPYHQKSRPTTVAHLPYLRCYRPHTIFSFKRCLHTDNARPSVGGGAFPDSAEYLPLKPKQPEILENPPRWAHQLNRSLPAALRILNLGSPAQDRGDVSQTLDARRLEKIMVRAQKADNVEILPWLVEHGYQKTAVWLMEAILNFSVPVEKTSPVQLPSNIDWPDNLFKDLYSSPVYLAPVSHTLAQPVYDESHFDADRMDSREAQARHRLLNRVWEALGVLTIRSAAANTDHAMDDNMLAVLLVLGQIHKLGMMPDGVYAYSPSRRPCFVQRPPILNLVSSRILTALSDVAWRQQQDDAIIQAASMGMSLKEISENVPGGRFRLKVRPLGPEVWLELILWCCIESQHATAAVAIIKVLAAQVEHPWFAIRWTSPQSDERLSTFIDWERVKLRHGGPAGLIEGYSREKPFVDVPKHTISAEVVLALVEKLIASNVSSTITNASKSSAYITHKDYRPVRKTLAYIEDVMAFLEPHDLPEEYFAYLETRLLHDGAFDPVRTPVDMYSWSTAMTSMRAMKMVYDQKVPAPSLELESVHAHSLAHVGLQHQAMDALVSFGNVHHTLAVFNEIQESVDRTKVTSITDFLQRQPLSIEKISTRTTSKHDLEYTNSHGQLPNYKFAGLLNLISETKLIGLGRWLLYADDVDGAMISERVWHLPCMTAALYRFAAASQDKTLLTSATASREKTGSKPTIKMERALVNANLDLLDFGNVRRSLSRLRNSQAGGFGLSNLVHLAAVILRLERTPSRSTQDGDHMVSDAMTMIHDLLSDSYSTTRGDFTLAQRLMFKQQVRHILSIFGHFEGSLLSKVAQTYAGQFPQSNLAHLPAGHFNILLAAAIETHSSEFGRDMWDKFCKSPESWTVFDSSENDNFGYDIEPDLRTASMEGQIAPPSTESTRDHDAVNQTSLGQEAIEFVDPFFPSPVSGAEVPLELGMDPSTRRPAELPAESGLKPIVTTVPSLQTLRLIVRAAADEFKSRQEQGLGVRTQERCLKWAVDMFKAFRLVDKTFVEQEIQVTLSELDAKVTEETEPALEAAQGRRLYEQASGQDLTVGASVSEMWIPSHRRPADITVYPEIVRSGRRKLIRYSK